MDLMMKRRRADRESEREEKTALGVGSTSWGTYCFCRGAVATAGL